MTVDAKGNLALPEIPSRDDSAALCSWLTAVFNLDTTHPITGGKREGLRGADGHVALTRVGAPAIRFEPVSKINAPSKLIETLSWATTAGDGLVHAFKAAHCRKIAYVIRAICDASASMTAEQETEAIVSTFMHTADLAEGSFTTYGTSGQRFEAAVALRRAVNPVTGRSTGPARYLIDENTGEMVVAVSDLQDAARRCTGSSVPHGWLDARMEALGWTRITVEGWELPGRAGRKGSHARVFAYRGHLCPCEPTEHVTK